MGRPIPQGLDGEVRRTVPGAKLHIDHSHPGAEFNLVIRGVGNYMLDGQIYELKPGTLIWMLPEKRHRLVRSPKLEMWVVSLKPELILPEWRPVIAERPSHVLPGDELMDLDRLLSQVAQDSDDPEAYNAGIHYAAARAWRASTDSPPSDVRPMHPAVTRALLLLREGTASISLSELADSAGIGAPYLSRLLVEHTGHSFLEWRNRIRIERFIEEYRPGANLLKLALDSGFGSYSRFHHAFLDMMGCSPSDWVKQGEDRPLRNEFDRRPLPDSHAVLHPAIISSRLRWTRLVPVVSPTVPTVLGPRLLERALASSPVAHAAESELHLDASLPESERRRFIASLEAESPVLAEEYDEVMGRHDIAGTYAGLVGEFGLSPQSLPDAVTAMATTLWTTIHSDAGDPGVGQVGALARQTTGALAAMPPDRDAAQGAHTALICHSVVLFHALQAARARGDPRAIAKLGDSAAANARRIFGQDMKRIGLSVHGFAREAGTPRQPR